MSKQLLLHVEMKRSFGGRAYVGCWVAQQGAILPRACIYLSCYEKGNCVWLLSTPCFMRLQSYAPSTNVARLRNEASFAGLSVSTTSQGRADLLLAKVNGLKAGGPKIRGFGGPVGGSCRSNFINQL